MSKSLARDSLLATYGLAFQGGSRLVYTIVIGRAFGARSLGTVSALLAIGIFVSLLWPTGSGLAASSYAARLRRGQLRTNAIPALNRQMLIALVAIAVLTGLTGWGIAGDPSLTIGCILVAVAYGAYVYARGAQLGLARFVRIAIWDTVCGLLTLGALVAVVVFDARDAMLLPLAVGYAVFAIRCWPRTTSDPAVPWRDRSVTRFVGANTVAQVAGGGIINLSMLSAHVFGTPLRTGLFAAAFALATPASMLGQSLQQVLLPYFSRGHDGAHRVRDMWRVILAAAGLLIAVFAVLVALAPFLIKGFFGATYASGATQMQWMLVAVLVASIALMPAAALIASGHATPFAWATIVGFVVGIGGMFGLGPWLGTWAAVVGYGAGASVTTVFTYGLFWTRIARSPSGGGAQPDTLRETWTNSL